MYTCTPVIFNNNVQKSSAIHIHQQEETPHKLNMLHWGLFHFYFISLKSALFPLLSCSHSTLRNITCTLYQSAHPQICLQSNIASPSLFKTNILSLLPPCCSEDPTEADGILCRYLTAGTAAAACFFRRRNCRRLKCAWHWGTRQDGPPSFSPEGHPGSGISRGWRPQVSPEPTPDQLRGQQ